MLKEGTTVPSLFFFVSYKNRYSDFSDLGAQEITQKHKLLVTVYPITVPVRNAVVPRIHNAYAFLFTSLCLQKFYYICEPYSELGETHTKRARDKFIPHAA